MTFAYKALLILTSWISLTFLPSVEKSPAQEEFIEIGGVKWAAENLATYHFSNGDSIPQARTIAVWRKAVEERTPAWCYFINDTTNTRSYGIIYNWYAVTDPRGLAPEGWKVPTNEEWSQLIDYAGGTRIAGKKLKSRYGWKDAGNGTNDFGFNALPSGSRYADGSFGPLETHAYFWTATQDGNSHAWIRAFNNQNELVKVESYYKGCGFSVRLVKKP